MASEAHTGCDLYRIDDLLNDEERMVRDSVREFVDKDVLPIIEDHYLAGTFPKSLISRMGELGLLGASLQGYGCAGLNYTAYGVICRELERGDSGFRSFCSVQGSLVMYPIHAFGSEKQKERWLPPMARGEAIGCFGLTEPDFGSNPAGMITRARKKGDRWVLNGAKMWITNGDVAHVSVVWAKDDAGVIRGFLVEKGTKGFKANEVKGKHSLRASDTAELVFEDCEIPAENLLPKSERLKSPLMCLNQARYGIAWGAVGAAHACYQCAANYSLTRVQFNRPIGGYQLVQKKLADMLTEITKAELLCWRLGRLKDEGKATHVHVCMAKRNNVAMALECARTAREILGGNGILADYPVFRHMANLESVYTYEGTHDIHTLILGQHITGMSAFEGAPLRDVD